MDAWCLPYDLYRLNSANMDEHGFGIYLFLRRRSGGMVERLRRRTN